MLILVIAIVTGISITGKMLEQQKLSERTGPIKVVKVIDGDTIDLEDGKTVRLSGINTPETGECYYEEAKQKLKELIFNKDVFLERDRTDIDRYDRLLRYIYLGNISINFLMVEEGYAMVFDKYKDDTKYYEQLKEVEKQAMGRGLWLCSNPRENCSYVGSKNSDIYHNVNSTIAKKIKPENLVCFKSIKEAEQAGYKSCSNC